MAEINGVKITMAPDTVVDPLADIAELPDIELAVSIALMDYSLGCLRREQYKRVNLIAPAPLPYQGF